jgi:hypothetical protein
MSSIPPVTITSTSSTGSPPSSSSVTGEQKLEHLFPSVHKICRICLVDTRRKGKGGAGSCLYCIHHRWLTKYVIYLHGCKIKDVGDQILQNKTREKVILYRTQLHRAAAKDENRHTLSEGGRGRYTSGWTKPEKKFNLNISGGEQRSDTHIYILITLY